MRPLPLLREPKPYKTPGGEMLWFGLVFWGRAATLILRQERLGRVVLLDCGMLRAGFGVGLLGSECLCCAVYHRWPCLYSEGQAREIWCLLEPLF